MKLDDFIELLTTVEFSQHVYGNQDKDGKYIHLRKLIVLINQGVRELHSRFLIKKGIVYLSVNSELATRYPIRDDAPYLLTSDVPLNTVKVLEVFTDKGMMCSLNKVHRYTNDCMINPLEVALITPDTLEFKKHKGHYKVIVQRSGEVIPKDIEDISKYDIDLPEDYITALTYNIAARMFAVSPPLDGYAAAYSPSVMYKKKYEEECARLINDGIYIDATPNEEQKFFDSQLP